MVLVEVGASADHQRVLAVWQANRANGANVPNHRRLGETDDLIAGNLAHGLTD